VRREVHVVGNLEMAETPPLYPRSTPSTKGSRGPWKSYSELSGDKDFHIEWQVPS
jgi:hypothetical protein